jgi:hypothetical protein
VGEIDCLDRSALRPEVLHTGELGVHYGAASFAIDAAASQSSFSACARIALNMTSRGVKPSADARSAISLVFRVAAPLGLPVPVLLPPRAKFDFL